MNILLKSLVNKNRIKFPYLFRYEDIFRIKANKTKLKNMFEKAVKRGIIENIYEDIYKLKLSFIEDKYILKRNFSRKRWVLMFVSEKVLVQLIDELKKKDFDELHGNFGIKIIEEFLENTIRDLL